MGPAANRTVEYFSTYEKREEAFRERVNALIPRKYGGPSLFWDDFRQISFDRQGTANGAHHAYITSNPRDSLAAFRVLQILPGVGPASAQRVWESLAEHQHDLGQLGDCRPRTAVAEQWTPFATLMARLFRRAGNHLSRRRCQIHCTVAAPGPWSATAS